MHVSERILSDQTMGLSRKQYTGFRPRTRLVTWCFFLPQRSHADAEMCRWAGLGEEMTDLEAEIAMPGSREDEFWGL